MSRFIYILILILGTCFGLSAQEAPQKILLMTGKTIEAKVLDRDSIYMHYDLYKKSGKTKSKKIDMERVFSILNDGGEEEVIYYMDTAIGNYFSVDEMRYYIKGEQDAMDSYKANWALAIGIPVSAGMGYFLSNSIFFFVVPAVTLVGMSIPRYKINAKNISSPTLASEPAYVLGYEHAARTKRFTKSLVAGLVGTAIGISVGQAEAQ